MTIALVFLAVLMAVVVWWLARHTLNVTPWVEQRSRDIVRSDGALPMPTIKVGLGVFLAVATSLFALSVSAYRMRMMEQDWTHLELPRVLWVNSALLVLASVALQWAVGAARRGRLEVMRAALLAGGLASWAFLVGQLSAWRQLQASGHFTAANAAYAFFLLLVTLHALHLLGGLWVWARTTLRSYRSTATGSVLMSVELCAFYWHFLLLVWAVLFTVLLHSHH